MISIRYRFDSDFGPMSYRSAADGLIENHSLLPNGRELADILCIAFTDKMSDVSKGQVDLILRIKEVIRNAANQQGFWMSGIIRWGQNGVCLQKDPFGVGKYDAPVEKVAEISNGSYRLGDMSAKEFRRDSLAHLLFEEEGAEKMAFLADKHDLRFILSGVNSVYSNPTIRFSAVKFDRSVIRVYGDALEDDIFGVIGKTPIRAHEPSAL